MEEEREWMKMMVRITGDFLCMQHHNVHKIRLLVIAVHLVASSNVHFSDVCVCMCVCRLSE